MPEATLGMVSACLWDLRALCEQQLRALTDAQRLTDEYRRFPHTRPLLKGRLVSDVAEVIRTTALVLESAQDCAGLVNTLPAAVADTSIQPT